MLRAIRQWTQPDTLTLAAHQAYLHIVEQARLPLFYREYAVPDTVDGRFDVIVLHLFLVIHRLRQEPPTQTEPFIRALCEVFFADMDRSLREMGSTDTGVGIRVKKMAKAFYGRLQAYEQDWAVADAFKGSLQRNLYRSQEQAPTQAVLDYMQRNQRALALQDVAHILQGTIRLTR